MFTPITNTVSTFVDSQLPEFVRDNNPNFGAFLKAYYAWMEQSNVAGVITQSKNITGYKDIDQTTDQFIQYYINDFLPYFPNDTALDKRKLIKAAREFYKKKGSIESVQFLFRVLYGLEADVYYPKDNILKASDGKWKLPQSIRLTDVTAHVPFTDGGDFSSNSSGNVDSGDFTSTSTLYLDGGDFLSSVVIDTSFDVSQLVGRAGYGSVSNAYCVIEAANRVVDIGLGLEIIELYISNLNKPFNDLENLNVTYGYDNNNNPLVFSEKIIASISNIVVDPRNRGLKYKGYQTDNNGNMIYPGDPVVISGGLQAGDSQAQKAVAFVNNVTSGSITGVGVDFGGYAYRVQPNTIVAVINDPSDTTGTGANVIVQGFDATNSTFLLLNNDSIQYKNNAILSSGNYGFANQAFCNINTALSSAFSFQNIQFAAITTMNVVNGGGAYTATPTLNLEVVYYSDYNNDLANISSYSVLANTLSYVDELGYMYAVNVISGGSGYSNVTDMIVVPSSIGYNAVFTFITTGNGVISSVNIANHGEGYIQLPMSLAVVNSANVANASAGAGASLIAYGYGQGANLNVAVNQIGQVTDFRIVNRGFDYISTPNVSLRIQDIILVDGNGNLTFSTDSTIYQGANANSVTYRALIDSYNVSTRTIRVYNYQGTLNPSQNLVVGSSNVSINVQNSKFLTTYGNGKAKANAIFLNGLIQYPGYYLNTDGFVSSDRFLQGANVYHNYSYVIEVEKSLRDYKKTLLDLVHPIGMDMLGKYILKTTICELANSVGVIAIEPAVYGGVFVNAYDINKILIGSGIGNTTTNSYWTLVTSNQSVFNITSNAYGSSLVSNSSYVIAMRNGLLEVPNVHYTINSNVITMNANCIAGDIFEARIFGGTANNMNVGSDFAIATANQTSFNMSVSVATENYVLATKNGLIQVPVLEYVLANSGSNVQFVGPCRFGDDVEMRSFTGNIGPGGNVIISSQHWVLNANQTVFTLPANVDTVTSVLAMKNGLVQVPGFHYTIASNNILTFSSNCRTNDIVEVRTFTGAVGEGPGTDFLITANSGDLITFGFNDGTRPTFTKVIETVVSNNILVLESNTQFPLGTLVSVSTNSNTINTSVSFYGNVANNDVVLLNVAGNTIYSIVTQSPFSNSLTTNTTFTVNISNLVMYVYPSVNSASYLITKKTI